jgi:hypothetical protein
MNLLSEKIDADKKKEFGGKFASQDWYRNKMFEVLSDAFTGDTTDLQDTFGLEFGKFYYFGYSAKHKIRYPYWDKYPLAQILKIEGGNILGANVHYLNPAYRGRAAKSWLNSSNAIPDICLHTYIPNNMVGISRVPDEDVEGLSKYIVELFVDKGGRRVTPNQVWSGNN